MASTHSPYLMKKVSQHDWQASRPSSGLSSVAHQSNGQRQDQRKWNQAMSHGGSLLCARRALVAGLGQGEGLELGFRGRGLGL